MMEVIGDGSYGRVWKARNRSTDEIVAIKVMKKSYPCLQDALQDPELCALRRIRHPNVIRLKDAHYRTDGSHSQGELCLVMEHMEMNLVEFMESRNGSYISIELVRAIGRKLLRAVAELHRRGMVHRDLKPENVLVDHDARTVKLADFGLARVATRRVPMTSYVATRWYRAPEILLHLGNYGRQADLFSVGCILAELITLKPLFPGKSDFDQFCKIARVIGFPTRKTWPAGASKLSELGIRIAPKSMEPEVELPPIAQNLVLNLCKWNPCHRPTALQALQDPFFYESDSKMKHCLQVTSKDETFRQATVEAEASENACGQPLTQCMRIQTITV